MATAGKILMFPVGNWTSGNNYGFLDIVYYGGSSYIAKTDITNSTVNPATDTTNWQILAHGYIADTLSGIDGIDTSGLLGTAGATATGQALIDVIADKVATKLIPYTHLVNNGTTTVTGQYALDGAYGKTLADGLTTLNSNLFNKYNVSTTEYSGAMNAASTPRVQRVGNTVIVTGVCYLQVNDGSHPIVTGLPAPINGQYWKHSVGYTDRSKFATLYIGLADTNLLATVTEAGYYFIDMYYFVD